jgi:hypothetical protein
MDTWIVSRKPIGLYEIHPSTSLTDAAAPPKVCLIQLCQSDTAHPLLKDLRVLFQGTHYGRSSKTRRICHRLCLAHQEGDLGTCEPPVLGWC